MSDLKEVLNSVNSLKEVQKLAKDTAKIVTDIQSDNNQAVSQAHKNRELEKKSKEKMLRKRCDQQIWQRSMATSSTNKTRD